MELTKHTTGYIIIIMKLTYPEMTDEQLALSVITSYSIHYTKLYETPEILLIVVLAAGGVFVIILFLVLKFTSYGRLVTAIGSN